MTVLEGDLVLLRPLAAEDAERVNAWHNDGALYETLLGEMYGPTPRETRAWLQDRIAAHGAGELNFAICLRDGGAHVGNLYIQDIDPETGIARYQGIFLAAAGDRAGGLGREATSLAMDYAMRTFGIQRIWGDLLADNAPSLRAMQAVGFEIEARFPGQATKRGLPRDVVRIVMTVPSRDAS